MKCLILFNGPPGCGKDFAAHTLMRGLPPKERHIVWEKMSLPIKKAFAGTMSLGIDWTGSVDVWEAKKDKIIPEFGMTYREWQIYYSESFMKPHFGNDILGKLFIERFNRKTTGFNLTRQIIGLVSGCGFQVEVDTLAKMQWPILIYRIHREGCNFVGDSRSYVESHAPGSPAPNHVQVIDLQNDGTPEFSHKVLKAAELWLSTLS